MTVRAEDLSAPSLMVEGQEYSLRVRLKTELELENQVQLHLFIKVLIRLVSSSKKGK